MKKLTAGILASLIGLVSANSAEAAVASTSYVDGAMATKQDTLTETNFIAPAETGDFISGFTVNNGTVTFTSGKLPDAAEVDAVLNETSTNAIQNQAVAKKIASMAATVPADAGNKVVKSVTQDDGTVTASYAQVTGADIAAETIESANIKNGTIVDADIANVAMGKVTGLDTALAGKQDNITWGTNITVGADGKVSATDTTYTAGAGIQLNGTEFSADVTTDILNTELAKKQNTLKVGANIQIAEDGTISATDTTYTTGTATADGLTKLYTTIGNATDGTMTQAAITTELGTKQGNLTAGDGITLDAAGNIAAKAGTGITIDANGISANNQLDAQQTEGDTGLQVLTRKNCVNGVCEYVWETIDRVYGD